MKLRTKLLMSYILLIACSFFVIYTVSLPLVRNYIGNKVIAGLEQEKTLVRSRTLNAIESAEDREEYITILAKERIAVERLGLSSTIGIFYINKATNEIITLPGLMLPDQTKALLAEKIANKDPAPFSAAVGDTENIIVYFSVSPNPNANVQRLFILMYTPMETINVFTRGFTKIMIIVFLAVMFISVIVSFMLAKMINNPVEKLKKQANELKNRNFSARSTVNTNDEFRELSNTLNAAAIELENHNRAQKDFLDNVSHELKTPLMSIQGYAEGIRDGVFEADEQTLDVIIEESIRLKRLVGEISYLSKLESIPDFYKFSQIEISEIINKSVDSVSGLDNARKVKVIRLNMTEKTIKGDEEKLTQLFINILSNSLRYAEKAVLSKILDY